ncbi:DUF4395 domain-containing protein [Neobacillus pocheonensis]|uniref:DUF4395 domain-containing protein n=1 Tax=Neobacillus pocheonensis TaxID=363869 RepID=UPI003D280047
MYFKPINPIRKVGIIISEMIQSIPRPLVKTNQWIIVVSVLLTWILGQEWILLVPFISGMLGLLFDFNSVMKIARLFLRKDPKSYIPEDWEQQQFNQKIAVSCLGIGFISFIIGWDTLGYIFTILVAVAAFVAILGFCVGCFIHFQWKQYKFRRMQH